MENSSPPRHRSNQCSRVTTNSAMAADATAALVAATAAAIASYTVADG